MKFKKFNNNPTSKIKGDCVIRSISIALDKSWIDVYDDLVLIGRKVKNIPNSKEVYEEYLNGYTSISQKVKKGEKRLTAGDFSDNGTYILRQANHLTTIKDGVLCDSWDCRKRAVYKYWIIKKGVRPLKLLKQSEVKK